MSKRNRKFHSSPSVMSPVNKRLNFEVDMKDGNDDVLEDLNQFDLELRSDEELEQFDKFSPCRTRSGLVYESGVKKHKFRLGRQSKLRSRTLSGQSGTGHLADCSENESETSNSEYTEDLEFNTRHRATTPSERPPPLNYFKTAVSRFSQIREKPHFHDIPSSPILDDLRSPSKELSDSKVNTSYP